MKKHTQFVEAGFDSNGNSTILNTRDIQAIQPMPEIPSFSITNMYYTEDYPLTTQTMHNDKPYDINLPPNAVRFLKCTIPPIKQIIKELNNPEVQSAEAFVAFGMHKTPSVDYFCIVKGNVTLYMENGSTHEFTTGSAFAMRGASHAWINFGDEDCELVGVMLGVIEE